MKLVDGRDYFACEYCTSFQFPSEAPAAVDFVKVLGEESDLSCPVCDVPLVAASIDQRRVLHCERCRGVLATNAEFAEIVKLRRASYEGTDRIPAPLDPEQLKRAVRCPSCGGVMDVHPYYGPGNVVVDTCSRCTLIWLDHGEISVIEKAPGRR